MISLKVDTIDLNYMNKKEKGNDIKNFFLYIIYVLLTFLYCSFRWDLQRIRELKRIEYLKEGRYKNHPQKSNDNNKEELTTLLPSPSNIKAIEITDKLPVSAFGSNLHIKKKLEMLVYCLPKSFFNLILNC